MRHHWAATCVTNRVRASLFESDPSSEAISDIQFVFRLPLRSPQGPDLINIFYGEPSDAAACINDSQQSLRLPTWLRWQPGKGAPTRLIPISLACDRAALLTARPCPLEANQKWFMSTSHNAAENWICFIYASLHHLSVEWAHKWRRDNRRRL